LGDISELAALKEEMEEKAKSQLIERAESRAKKEKDKAKSSEANEEGAAE
jgi:outer membrane lipopolysaccharide assembly protein LptE/RlpB